MPIIQSFIPEETTLIPIVHAYVTAGFPSPALDYQDEKIDLNRHLVKHPASTFYIRVCGDSMLEKGIFPQDLVVVDKSLPTRNGSIVVAILNGEFTIKEFFQDNNKKFFLKPANKNYPIIEVKSDDEFEIWGVATHVIHGLRPQIK